MKIPKGNQDLFYIPVGSLEDEDLEGEEGNPFHGVEHVDNVDKGGLKEKLLWN